MKEKKSFLIQAQAHVYEAAKNGEFCTESTLLPQGVFSSPQFSLPLPAAAAAAAA